MTDELIWVGLSSLRLLRVKQQFKDVVLHEDLDVDGPEGRSRYCLNLNCRAPPGRFFRLDLTGWWRDV